MMQRARVISLQIRQALYHWNTRDPSYNVPEWICHLRACRNLTRSSKVKVKFWVTLRHLSVSKLLKRCHALVGKSKSWAEVHISHKIIVFIFYGKKKWIRISVFFNVFVLSGPKIKSTRILRDIDISQNVDLDLNSDLNIFANPVDLRLGWIWTF